MCSAFLTSITPTRFHDGKTRRPLSFHLKRLFFFLMAFGKYQLEHVFGNGPFLASSTQQQSLVALGILFGIQRKCSRVQHGVFNLEALVTKSTLRIAVV
jgi:hypothetical protein